MHRPPFRETLGPNDFLGPLGRRYFVGRCFCYWQDEARALGTIMWGRPREADIDAMIPFFEMGVDARFAGHASFVDGRDLEAIDVVAFGKLLAYLIARRHAWGPNVGRQAILHPSGFVGVVVAGALQVARPSYPFACFQDQSTPAFDWCGVPDLRAEVEALRASVRKTSEVVRAVREVLRRRGSLSLADVAAELGVSQRTLQRRLHESGTSLRNERDEYLSERIEHLLGGTDLSLDAIAAEVGLTSASHLVSHFRGTHGTTPGSWRARRRA